jgi:heme-degrading monooxygenase HmoA
MYSQVVTVQFQQGKLDEGVGVFKDAIFPLVRQRPGFQKVYLLVEREQSRALAVSFWDSKEDVESLLTSGFFQEQAGKLADKLAGPPERAVYEVAVES